MKKKILIVDDEEDLCEILSFNLNAAGFEADVAYSAEEAYIKLRNNYDLLLLDVMMGAISGYKLAELIREDYSTHVPIIFISAKDREADKLIGFKLGADDYISKPFSIKEVIARIHAVLNRTATKTLEKSTISKPIQDLIVYKELKINALHKTVSVNDKFIKLTHQEFEILLMLTQSPGKLFSRSDILNKIWDDQTYVIDRTIDVHIARLRKKIAPIDKIIVNRSGYGYCFDPNEN